MIRAALLLPLVLVGCAANDVVRGKPPVVAVTSMRPVADVQECIIVALTPLSGLQVTREPNTRIITIGSKAHTAAVVTLAGENPVQIEVRQAGVFNRRWRNAIRACATNDLR